MNMRLNSNVVRFKPKNSLEKREGSSRMDRAHVTMLYALTQYAVSQLEIGQDAVLAMLLSAFQIRCLEQLQQTDFDRAVAFVERIIEEHAPAQ